MELSQHTHLRLVLELLTRDTAVMLGMRILLRSSRPAECLSCDGCLEDKTEDYQNCPVMYCVLQ